MDIINRPNVATRSLKWHFKWLSYTTCHIEQWLKSSSECSKCKIHSREEYFSLQEVTHFISLAAHNIQTKKSNLGIIDSEESNCLMWLWTHLQEVIRCDVFSSRGKRAVRHYCSTHWIQKSPLLFETLSKLHRKISTWKSTTVSCTTVQHPLSQYSTHSSFTVTACVWVWGVLWSIIRGDLPIKLW